MNTLLLQAQLHIVVTLTLFARLRGFNCSQHLYCCCLLQAAARDAEKLPNEVQLGCYTVSTYPVKGAIERQMKELKEEMLASLRRKVRRFEH